MFMHVTVRALPNTLLFWDWTEARALWERLRIAFPDARAICLMPNHPHVLTDRADARSRMLGVMSGYARWRGAWRGQDARCWQPLPRVETLPDDKHLRRMVRYVHLNPCRGELVRDPLTWPFSTHRDQAGLGDPDLCVDDPERQHAYVSGDPSVAVEGTELPRLVSGFAPLPTIAIAVGAVLRIPPERVRAERKARRLLARAAWLLENRDTRILAEYLEVSRTAVYQMLDPRPSPMALDEEGWLASVLRAVGDPRLGPLELRPRANPTRWSGWRLGPS